MENLSRREKRSLSLLFINNSIIYMLLTRVLFAVLIVILLYQQTTAQDIPGRRMDDIVIEVMPEEELSDDYWIWFVNYVEKRTAQRYLFNENRIKLSMLAKEIKSRRSRWLKLLIEDQRFTEADFEATKGYWWLERKIFGDYAWYDVFTSFISGGKPDFPRIVAYRDDLKSQRNKLASEIKKLHSEQDKLVYETINETIKLYENVYVRFKKSGVKYPELKGEVDRLDEEQRLLKLILYDAAEWYAPHKLTKLIKQYETRKDSVPEHLQLLYVRALIGEAEWLEEKVYLQHNSPSYQDSKVLRKQAEDNIDYYRQFLEITKPVYNVAAPIVRNMPVVSYIPGMGDKIQPRIDRSSKPSRGTMTDSVDPGDPIQILARSARFDAMMILRDINQRMPDKQDILQELLQQELFFIQRIADKINVEQRVSMMAFYGYLKERGFGQKDLKDDPNVTWDPLFSEQFWASLGMGPIAALSAISVDTTVAGYPIPAWLFPDDWLGGTPEALAEIVGDAQQKSARNRVAINALMRMIKHGLKLSQLPDLNPETMSKYLVAQHHKKRNLPPLVERDIGGRTLSPDRLKRLLDDIKEMMSQLPELHALVSGDLISFSKAFGRGHYPSIHPEYTWYEWFGDIFNAKNIVLLWGPGSVYSLNGKVVFGGPMRSALFREGVTITAREKFVETVGLGRLSKWIVNGPVGKTLLDQRGPALLINTDKYFKASRIGAAYSLMSSVGNVGATIANSLLLYGGASVLAQQYGYGPSAQLLIEAVAEIGVADLLADAMRAGGINPGRIVAAADEISDRATKQMKAAENRNAVIDRIQEAASSPAKTKGQAKKIKKVQQEAAETFIPEKAEVFPQDLAEASDYAGAHASKALKKGDSKSVNRAAGAGKKVNKELKDQAEKLDKQAKKSRKLVKQAEAGVPPKSTISRDELHNQFIPTVDQRMNRSGPYERFWAPKMHKEKVAGAIFEAGDHAVRNGSLANALDHYTEARVKLIEAAKRKPPLLEQEEMLDLLDQRIAMIMEYHDTNWARKAANEFAGDLNHKAPISTDLANDVATRVDAIVIDITESELKRLNGLKEDIEVTILLRDRNLRGVTDQARRNEIISMADQRIAQLKAQQYPGVEGVEFFRLGPGSAMWKVEHEGETFFVKHTLQPADINALELDSAASVLAQHLEINTFTTKLNKGQRNKLLVSRGVDIGADFGDLNDGEVLAFLDEYAEQCAFRAWLGDPDGHAGNIMIGKDGHLLPFDFDRAQLTDSRTHTLYDPTKPYPNEGELMRGTVLFKHGSVGVIEDDAVNSFLRGRIDKGGKHYAAMARIQQMMSYKRMKKTVDKIKKLANNRDKLKALLEKGGWPDVETAVKVLQKRAKELEETLKPLFDNELIDGVPRIITSQADRSQGDHDQVNRVELNNVLCRFIQIRQYFQPADFSCYLREAV